MSFECKNCNEEVSSVKMAGLVFGQITAANLASKGIKTQTSLKSAFDLGEFTAGFVTGLGIKCPSCKKSNWK